MQFNFYKSIYSCGIVVSIVLWSSKLHAQILNVDKLDTAAYDAKATWAGNIGGGVEIDKQKIAVLLQWQFQVSKKLQYNLMYNGLYDDQPLVPIHRFYFPFSNSFVCNL